MKKIITFIICLFLQTFLISQSIYIDNLSNVTLKNGGNIYVKDTSVNAIYSSGGGFYVPDTLGGFVEWNIQNNKGIYEVPFISYNKIYLPVLLNITTAGSGTSIKFSSTDTAVIPTTSYYNSNSINKYWTIDFSNYSIMPIGTIKYNYDINNIPYQSNNLIAKYFNTYNLWADVSSAIYYSGSVVLPINQHNLNKTWTLVNSSSLLPVSLIFFNGENKDNTHSNLTWQTLVEINNKGFEIEKSYDGINFNYIGWVYGNGNSTIPNRYKFDDYLVESGKTYYYRLKQLDYNNQYSYSNIVSVNFLNSKQNLEYYNLLGQKIDLSINFINGVYLKHSNGKSNLIGIIKN